MWNYYNKIGGAEFAFRPKPAKRPIVSLVVLIQSVARIGSLAPSLSVKAVPVGRCRRLRSSPGLHDSKSRTRGFVAAKKPQGLFSNSQPVRRNRAVMPLGRKHGAQDLQHRRESLRKGIGRIDNK